MKLVLLGLACCVATTSQAICIRSPTEKRVQEASVVALVVVTGTRLGTPLKELQDRRPHRIDYAFDVLENFKGDAASIRAMYSRKRYHDPYLTPWNFSEETRWTIGDVVLVVANDANDVDISFCGAYMNHEVGELQRIRQLVKPGSPAPANPAPKPVAPKGS